MGITNKEIWEKQRVEGKHVSTYPFSELPSCIFRKYGRDTDKSNIKVLELGSGTGNNLWFFAREGFNVYGIEISKTAVNISRKLLKKENLKADIIVGSFVDLSMFKDSYFDLVLDRCSLYCLDKADFYKALSEVSRVLKRGGSFLSFMYSDESECLKYGEKIGENTYQNFKKGPFEDVGMGNFVNVDELLHKVYRGYSVEYIKRVRYDYVYPGNENEIEIFITMGDKN